MPRFFCESKGHGNELTISQEDTKHILKVLRMRVSDKLTLSDGYGSDYDCEITAIPLHLGADLHLGAGLHSSADEQIGIKILRKYENDSEPPAKITLYQCLSKGDKLEFIVQKAVELGVCEIVPVVSRFCVAKNSKEDFEKKRARLQKIALEAAKQSGRGIIPTVSALLTFEEAVAHESQNANSIIFYEGGGEYVHSLIDKNADRISVFVGSEGGFSTDEIALAVENGIKRATLGKLILRCETAPIVGVTLVLNAIGLM